MNDKIPELRKKAMSLPLTPGVYIMRNSQNEIIYIGKAKKLKNRVSQYFGSQNNLLTKVKKMVENVFTFDYVLCDTELEALILECSLIKQHTPKYNILLKDDKGYSYIKISNEPFGKIESCFRKDDSDSAYLGPFTSGYNMRNLVEETNKIYKLPTCNKNFPRDIKKSRPCLNYHIGQCMGVCTGKISLDEYNEALKDAVEYLKGGQSQQIKSLKEQMNYYSDNLLYEKAGQIRDRIKAIENMQIRQKVVSSSIKNQDVFSIVQSDEKACLNVLRFKEGMLYDSEYFIIDAIEDLIEGRYELIMNYYSGNREIPPRITVDGETADSEILSTWLTEKSGRKVVIAQVKIGEMASVLTLCRKNASERLAQYLGRKGTQTDALDELKTLLGLEKIPEYIESYDISHTAGSDNVAGMVVFRNAIPYKKAYKRFSIKGFSGQDDYASMNEIIERRFKHYFDENEKDEGFKTLPDLILLDGGLGQIHAVKPILDKLGINVPLFGMVKDSKHKTRAIAYDGGEISITSKRSAFTLISTIQEEVHRFSITYHKTKHSKAQIKFSLTDIEGIGEKKAQILLSYFNSINAISNASIEDLQKIKGINRYDAERIFRYFKGE